MRHRNLILAATALLLGAAPLAQAGERHVDISVDLGYYLPAHLRYVRNSAPVVIAPPVPHAYYRPVYAQPRYHYYRHDHRWNHRGWRHRHEQRYDYRHDYRDGRGDRGDRDGRGHRG